MAGMKAKHFKQATGDIRSLTTTEKARLSRGEYPLQQLRDSPMYNPDDPVTKKAREDTAKLPEKVRKALRGTLRMFKKAE
jgi:hypothetical protein